MYRRRRPDRLRCLCWQHPHRLAPMFYFYFAPPFYKTHAPSGEQAALFPQDEVDGWVTKMPPLTATARCHLFVAHRDTICLSHWPSLLERQQRIIRGEQMMCCKPPAVWHLTLPVLQTRSTWCPWQLLYRWKIDGARSENPIHIATTCLN